MGKIYVLDTNVLIQAPYAPSCFEENEVVIPLVVLEELDNLKKDEGERGANVRRAIRFLEQDHPQIRIKEIDLFTTELFNQTVSTQDLLMFTDCWSNVQPMLVTLPVDWDFTIPYGLIYAKNTRKELLKFIQSLRP